MIIGIYWTINNIVEIHICLCQSLQIVSFQKRLKFPRRLVQIPQCFRTDSLAGEPGRQLLQSQPDFQNIVQILLCNLCHLGALSGNHNHKPLKFQHSNRFPDRRPGYPQLICQLDLHQPLPRLQFAAQDRLTQRVEYHVSQREKLIIFHLHPDLPSFHSSDGHSAAELPCRHSFHETAQWRSYRFPPVLPPLSEIVVRNVFLANPLSRRLSQAFCAVSLLSKRPNTVGPLPLIIAFSAPFRSISALISSITGYAGQVTVSSTFPIFAAIPLRSFCSIAFRIPSISGCCSIFFRSRFP